MFFILFCLIWKCYFPFPSLISPQSSLGFILNCFLWCEENLRESVLHFFLIFPMSYLFLISVSKVLDMSSHSLDFRFCFILFDFVKEEIARISRLMFFYLNFCLSYSEVFILFGLRKCIRRSFLWLTTIFILRSIWFNPIRLDRMKPYQDPLYFFVFTLIFSLFFNIFKMLSYSLERQRITQL